MELSSLFVVGFAFTAGSFILFLIIYFTRRQVPQSDENQREFSKQHSEEGQQKNGSTTATAAGSRVKGGKTRLHSQSGQQQFEHSWLSSTLKGHSRSVLDLDFSSNGKHLITCSEDRSLIIWNTNDFDQKEHKSVKGNLELDHAKYVRFAPDSKSILICLAFANTLTVYKMVKKEGGTGGYKIQPIEGLEFPALHKQDIINIGISCNGKKVSIFVKSVN